MRSASRLGGRVLAAASLCLSLAVAGCGGSGAAAGPCDPRCTGTINGAKYEILMPAHWNGTLLLYSHGYRGPDSAASGPQTSGIDYSRDGSDAVSRQLLGAGYALAGSGYRSNGWSVADGVAAGEDLHRRFLELVGTPTRTLVWGDSMGGLVTAVLAQENPGWVNGAAALCGVVAGPNANFDLFLDIAAATKAVLDPGLRLTGFTSSAQAAQQFSQLGRLLVSAVRHPHGDVWARLVFVAAIGGLPLRDNHFDGHDPASQAGAAAESIDMTMQLGILGRPDVEHRAGGNPSGDIAADFAARLTPAYRALITRLGGNPDRLVAALNALPRIRPDAAARARLAATGTPTGALAGVPTLTLHTAADPLVVVQNESVLRDRVAAHRRSADLLQLYIAPPARYRLPPPGAGHCAFSPRERIGAVRALDAWVRTGRKPAGPALAADLGPGFAPAFRPGPWPGGTP